ncbi:MAG: SDR family NAD(P)-dependent oxidoreductase [Pseudomonadota bacterium]
MQDVNGKVAFITGGASGMGLAMARSFAAAGMKVVIADIEQAALDSAAEEFTQSNREVMTVRLDVTDRDAMAAAADAVEERFGAVHVVVNNAGVAIGGGLDAMEYKDWDWVLGVNIDGVVNGLQTFVERIKRHGEGGHIVNTASMAGHLGIPGLGVYNASKWAVVGISETLQADLAPHNIGVSVLCPGVVRTNIFNSGRNRPDELQNDGHTDTGNLFQNASGDSNAPDASAAQERLAEIMQNALDPQVVGDMVLHAIQSDDLYIFTHPELREAVSTRVDGMNAAFDKWQSYRDEHGV